MSKSPYGSPETCEIGGDDCSGDYGANRLCGVHYSRWRRGALPERGGRTPKPYTKRRPGEWGPWKKSYQGYIERFRVTPEGVRERQFEHRLTMESSIERKLEKHENVHHINGVRDDNRIENLELWSTSQPFGQRVEDKVEWAREILAVYGHPCETENCTCDCHEGKS